MGNTIPSTNRVCCCTTDDLSAAAMDMVNAQQGLTQGAFLKEIQVHNPNNGNREEEISFHGATSSSMQVRDRRSNGQSNEERDPRKQLRRAILLAVRKDDAPQVLEHVADGVDVPMMNEAMRLAAHRGSSAVVRELVAVGLSVNEACPSTGFTPLQLAAVSGHVVVCELLLDALADVHRPVGGSTALMLARKMGNTEIEEVIERHVASVLLMNGDNDDSAHFRRAHVLPRVSPVLSEAVMQAAPPRNFYDLDEKQVLPLKMVCEGAPIAVDRPCDPVPQPGHSLEHQPNGTFSSSLRESSKDSPPSAADPQQVLPL
mmetsp:Transcript_94974/g.207729  ORF Transcript_94974/g.207729 Transcript_94974/m.207729 type:complete len:316 (+) Transcript_94974:127-1074(+)